MIFSENTFKFPIDSRAHESREFYTLIKAIQKMQKLVFQKKKKKFFLGNSSLNSNFTYLINSNFGRNYSVHMLLNS